MPEQEGTSPSIRVSDEAYAVIVSAGDAVVPDEILMGLPQIGFVTLERPVSAELWGLLSDVKPEVILLNADRSFAELTDTVVACAETNPQLLVVLLHSGAPATLMADCLQAGADLCYRRDEDPEFILASMQAAVRPDGSTVDGPRNASRTETIHTGDLYIDFARHQVTKRGAPIPLTPTEFRILTYLATPAGTVRSVREITDQISPEGYASSTAPEMIKTYIRRIRQKIEDEPDRPEYVLNVRGFGYLLKAMD